MAAVFRNSKFSVNVNLALAYGTIAATMLVGLANISKHAAHFVCINLIWNYGRC